MSLTTLPIEHEYEPGDAQAPEAIPFQFLSGADIAVEHLADATGAISILYPDADYVIAGDGPAGTGTITATADWPAGDKFLLRRRTAIKQDAAINAHQALPSKDVARQLDRQAMGLQEVRADADDTAQRALSLPRGEVAIVLPAAEARAGLHLAFDAEGQPVLSQGTGSDGALRADLAEPTGATLSRTSRGFSVERELTWARAATPASINEFYDALNGAAAERIALEAAAATGRAVSWRGTLTMDQPPDLPAHTTLIGEGSTSDNGTRGRTCIVRGFADSEPLLLLQSDTTLRNIDVDGNDQGTGDNIQIIGERVMLDNVSTRKAGRHGVWIGDLDNDTLNANCWSFYALKSIYNAGAGLYIHHTNSDTGVTWPIGAANVNAGSLFGGDIRSNGGHGVHIGNAVDNKFYGFVGQNNIGSNIFLDDYARGNCFFSPYSELGGAADTLAALSSGNLVLGTSSVVPPAFVDNGSGNLVMRHDASLKEQVFSGRVGIAPVFGSDTGGHLNIYNDALDLAAQIFGRTTGTGSQGKGVATAKRNGNAPLDIFEWQDGVGLNILDGALRVAGTQVVGARGAEVADALNAAGDPSQSEFNALVAQFNALLARVRAHGLIA